MKKYNLELKNPNKSFTFDGVVSHSSRNSEYNYLSNEVEGYDYRRSDSDRIVFTQEEINILPHGLVKLHDIIEVEEELYYIKLKGFHKEAYSYINVYDNDFSKWELDRNTENPNAGYRTKFTLKEIKDSLPEYEKLKVNVRADERVLF